MAKTVKRKNIARVATRLTNKARRMEALADWIEDDDAFVRKVQRAEKFYSAADRLKAKIAGKEAGVLIAKARKAKVKKEQLTKMAKKANELRNVARKAATGRKISLAAGGGGIYIDGYTDPMKIKSWGRKSKYTTNELREIPELERSAKILGRDSKRYARKSGGTATGIKRTAEAALSRIATGKALKGMARAGGVLGIAALAAQALRGTEPKKKRG